MAGEHDSGEFSRAEGNQEPAARFHPVAKCEWQVVGEGPVQRNRQADVAVLVIGVVQLNPSINPYSGRNDG